MTDYVGPSDLGRDLHGFPHYNGRFHEVDSYPAMFNTDTDQGRDYVESLIVIASVLIGFSVFCVVLEMFMRCMRQVCMRCCACCGDVETAELEQRRPWSGAFKFVLLVLALGVLTASAVLMRYNEEMGGHMEDVVSRVDLIYKHYKHAVFLGGDTRDGTLEARDLTESILENHELREDIRTKLQEVKSAYDSAARETDKYVDYADEISPHFVVRYVDEYGPYCFGWTSFTLGIVLAVFFALLLMIVLVRKVASPCARVTVDVMMLVLIGFIWITTAVQVGVAVGVADVCMGPDETIIANTAVSLRSQTPRDIVDYYVTCDPSATNPLAGPIAEAEGVFISNKSPIADLVEYANETGSDTGLKPLSDYLQQLNNVDLIGGVAELNKVLQCTVIVKPSLVFLENHGCRASLESLWIIIVAQACMAAGLAAARYLLVWPCGCGSECRRSDYEEINSRHEGRYGLHEEVNMSHPLMGEPHHPGAMANYHSID